jgi:dihydropteroate synthase
MRKTSLAPILIRNRRLGDERVHIVGILNVTPDSFSDGGRFVDVPRAVDHALAMARDGAAIIDIGGESTRPGAASVNEQEELDRVIPVIEAIRRERAADVPISIDTTKAKVAELAIQAGADMINDISGLRFDGRMADVAAAAAVPVVCMHIQGTPRDMQVAPHYDDVFSSVSAWLLESIAIAARAGIPRERLIVDPGIGFGKTDPNNLELIRRAGDLAEVTGCPVLLGPSRKSFLARLLDRDDPDERVFGTAAAVALGALHGARFLRVHDVREMADVLTVCAAIEGS